MTKYRRIRSVAHNLGHSFLSDMNALSESGRWTIVPRVIFAKAAEAGVPRIRIDVLNETVAPAAVDVDEVRQSVRNYARSLPGLLRGQGVAPEAVTNAVITLSLDHGRTRRATYLPGEVIPEFTCVVEMTDDRGRVHRATPTVWQ